jgi:sulfhydrogenase subunit beta (sulfur reductase)
MATTPRAVLEFPALEDLIQALSRLGYQVIGPVVRDGAIALDTVEKLADLPAGWSDRQEAASYRIAKGAGPAVFDHTAGPHSWKRFLHSPEERVFEGTREESGAFRIIRRPPQVRYAFLGVRACELAAIGLHDRVFLSDRYVDGGYRARREGAFLVAVNCTRAGGTCFCTSMGTGPRAEAGFDLALTELVSDGQHVFVAETGSEQGAAVLKEVKHRKASREEIVAAEAAIAAAREKMGRALDTAGLRELMFESFEHPRWDKTARRCLSCANCTMVCPTCFCTTVEDVSDVAGEHAERWRKWDSCFTDTFTYIHGGSIRLSVKSRYRQWITHKLAAWVDQFGAFGCVGCGRCITWCPAKIDITEEVRAIRGGDAAAPQGT